MSILAAIIDHRTAGLGAREPFAFTDHRTRQALTEIKKEEGIDGAVLLCTCNRTELYVSGRSGSPDPVALLCRAAGADEKACRSLFRTKSGDAAARHLMEVASGLRSEIPGDDQIVSQVKAAAELARELKCADQELETLFRLAATAAKKIKTQVLIRAVPASAANRAVDLLSEKAGGLRGLTALVIGNGEMGRLAAQLLVARGCSVTVTLRTYKHGETIVPQGCATIPYDRRLEGIAQADMVVSATKSPHFTLTRAMLEGLPHRPRYLVDLAVPRDIEPCAATLPGTAYFNIDSLGDTHGGRAAEVPDRCREIIEDCLRQFHEWKNIRACIPVIGEIKRLVKERVNAKEEEAIGCAVDKTVDMLIYAMKEQLTPGLLNTVKEHIEA